MHLREAKAIMDKCIEKLRPHSLVIDPAGSIRRERADVKDIEILALPKQVLDKSGEKFLLFDDTSEEEKDVKFKRSPDFIKAVESLGTIVSGKHNGKYMKIDLPQGIRLDLFTPSDFDYYRQLAIRTGSADWVKKYISTGWNKVGWCGSDQGLRKISQCDKYKDAAGNYQWKCNHPNPTLPPVWKSEQEFFEWIHVKWVPPKYREVNFFN